MIKLICIFHNHLKLSKQDEQSQNQSHTLMLDIKQLSKNLLKIIKIANKHTKWYRNYSNINGNKIIVV